jgi:hypothetical protein
MENKKFSVKVIEEGRLTNAEANQCFGGAVTCTGWYSVTTCYAFTECTRTDITKDAFLDCGDSGFTKCPVSYTNSTSIGMAAASSVNYDSIKF